MRAKAINPEFAYEELEQTMNCARWLVGEFEQLECHGLARIFQRAVEDSEIWIQHMAESRRIPDDAQTLIENREVKNIREILVKYASISSPDIRKSVIQKMMQVVEKSTLNSKIN